MSRNLPSLSDVLSLAEAVFTGEKVPDKVIEARLAACQKCDYLRKDKHHYCGLCNCQVSSPKTRIMNLAAYAEKLPKWGCKHPGRKYGLGWPQFTPAKGQK